MTIVLNRKGEEADVVCFMAITLYLPGGLRKTTVKITCTIPNEILRVH
jgi:hypothetical protein